MQNETTPAEVKDSAQTASESALRGAACCASYFGAKVAFEIPKAYEAVASEAWKDSEIPDDLIDSLFELFPGECEFEHENLCSPHLIVVNVSEPITAELVENMARRINNVLHNDERMHHYQRRRASITGFGL